MTAKLYQILVIVISMLLCVEPLRAAETLAFYYTYKTSSSSDYLAEYDLTLESSRYSVLRDLAALEPPALDEVDWGSSASFAQSYIVPYATGGRLFTLRGWGSGRLDIQEFDPQTLNRIGAETSIFNTDLLSYTSVVNVVMNPGIVYWFNSDTDLFDRDRGWESYVLQTGSRQFMNLGCSNFRPTDGDLYCFEALNASGDVDFDGVRVDISKRDPVTGDVIADLGSWIFPTAVSPSGWGFDVTDSTAYLVRSNAGNIELWEFDMAAFQLDPATAAPPTMITGWSGGADPFYMDAYGDFVMVGIDNSNKTAVVYQRSTASIALRQLAVSPSEPVLMVQEAPVIVAEEEGDAGGTNNDPDPGIDPAGDESSTTSGSGGGNLPISLLILFALFTGVRSLRGVRDDWVIRRKRLHSYR